MRRILTALTATALAMALAPTLSQAEEATTYTVVSPSLNLMYGGSRYVAAPSDTAFAQALIAEGEVQIQPWFYPADAEDYPWWCQAFGSAYGRIQQDVYHGDAWYKNRIGLRFGMSSEPLYWSKMSVVHGRAYVDVSTRGAGPGVELTLAHLFTISVNNVDGPTISGGLIIPLVNW